MKFPYKVNTVLRSHRYPEWKTGVVAINDLNKFSFIVWMKARKKYDPKVRGFVYWYEGNLKDLDHLDLKVVKEGTPPGTRSSVLFSSWKKPDNVPLLVV